MASKTDRFKTSIDIPAGTRVVVTGIQGLTLDVRPAD